MKQLVNTKRKNQMTSVLLRTKWHDKTLKINFNRLRKLVSEK